MKTWRVAGVDEVGRGCLTGSVIAAAVIFPSNCRIAGLKDSKKLSVHQRQALCAEIFTQALAWSIGRAEPSEVDRINVLQASLLAMRRAVVTLPVAADQVLVDGSHSPMMPVPCQAIVGGDNKIPAICAASIVAKVVRDREMQLLDHFSPGYGIGAHKGYPTQAHRQSLIQKGPSIWHRKSFAPVRRVLSGN